MLYVLEEHQVKGPEAQEFERTFREGWESRSGDQDARLMWYWDVAHGTNTGPSYMVMTVTAVRDGAAWERTMDRLRYGDLRTWNNELEAMRYRLDGRTLLEVPWSPGFDRVIEDVPAVAGGHERAIWLIDYGHPYAPLDDYVKFQEEKWYKPEGGVIYGGMARLEGFFTTAYGTGRRPEGVFIEKILDFDKFFQLLQESSEMHVDKQPVRKEYMSEGLKYRDQWDSILVRTSSWSPVF